MGLLRLREGSLQGLGQMREIIQVESQVHASGEGRGGIVGADVRADEDHVHGAAFHLRGDLTSSRGICGPTSRRPVVACGPRPYRPSSSDGLDRKGRKRALSTALSYASSGAIIFFFRNSMMESSRVTMPYFFPVWITPGIW